MKQNRYPGERNGPVMSAQESIPFERMFPDGICRVRKGYYTQTVQFRDINYHLARKEEKEEILAAWCRFLNSFDPSIRFELSFYNRRGNGVDARLALRGDSQDPLRKELNRMLGRMGAAGNRRIFRDKYLTFGIEAENLKVAVPRLEQIGDHILEQLGRLGVDGYLLDGKERLAVMHRLFHLDGREPFRFEWRDLLQSGLTVKDYITPTSFAFPDGFRCRIGETFGAVSFLSILAPELTDQMLRELLKLDREQAITLHLRSVDQAAAIKKLKRTITELDRSKLEEQKRALRGGYDMDVLPVDLESRGKDAKGFLQELMSRNERMFQTTILILSTGRTQAELEANVEEVSRIVQQFNCSLWRLDYEQEAGLMSCLPLADNQVGLQRDLTTSSVGIFLPFYSRELCQNTKEALYYGVNALSLNPILADRKTLKNPNGLILGTSGSGKSFAAKRELVWSYLATEDDIVICDPEAEYLPLVQRLQGQVITISPDSTQYINPLDIHGNYSEGADPVKLKADFILSFFELILGRKEEITGLERSVIDRCVGLIYRRYFRDPRPERMPVLEDLYQELMCQPEKEARRAARALEIYVKGSLNLFNHRTNIDIHNRLVCYDIRELGSQLKKTGMLIVQDQVWGRVTRNRQRGKSTRYLIDEFHLLLKEPQTASYSVEIYKRFRKWGGIVTGVTQDIKDLLASREISNIFENCEYICMLNQRGEDRDILARHLHISPRQLSFVTQAAEGEGLLFFGNVILPFKDRFPKDTELYRLMTTRLSERETEGGTV